jgi:hypothetical protein
MSIANASISPYRSFASRPRFGNIAVQPNGQGHEIQSLIAQLGVKSSKQPSADGLVQMDEPLIDNIAAYGEQAIPYLAAFFNRPQPPIALAEGIYAAQKLAQNKVKGVETLYGYLSRYNASPNPLIQTYLAGFYRRIDQPAAFGPMLGTMIQQSVYNYPLQGDPNRNISEEVGGSVLKIIAKESAKETVKMLLPYLAQLQAPQPATNAFQTSTP